MWSASYQTLLEMGNKVSMIPEIRPKIAISNADFPI